MLLPRDFPSLVQLTDTGGSALLKQSVSNVEFSGTERFLSSGFKCGGTTKKNLIWKSRWDNINRYRANIVMADVLLSMTTK